MGKANRKQQLQVRVQIKKIELAASRNCVVTGEETKGNILHWLQNCDSLFSERITIFRSKIYVFYKTQHTHQQNLYKYLRTERSTVKSVPSNNTTVQLMRFLFFFLSTWWSSFSLLPVLRRLRNLKNLDIFTDKCQPIVLRT